MTTVAAAGSVIGWSDSSRRTSGVLEANPSSLPTTYRYQPKQNSLPLIPCHFFCFVFCFWDIILLIHKSKYTHFPTVFTSSRLCFSGHVRSTPAPGTGETSEDVYYGWCKSYISVLASIISGITLYDPTTSWNTAILMSLMTWQKDQSFPGQPRNIRSLEAVE